MSAAAASKKVTIFGGTGFVGSTVAKLCVERGHTVTCLSRRGVPASPVEGVRYLSGDATDAKVVESACKDAEAVVHAVGLLFDVTTPGGGALNLIVSGSKSRPGEGSTYDAITRQTAFNVINALKKRIRVPGFSGAPPPLAFVSAAEAGWPDVAGGKQAEALAPDALNRYLVAKRSVEAELLEQQRKGALRPIIYRPSLIWDWSKLDVLPIIPIFNIACALGVPFVDKTVRVETLAAAIVAGIEDPEISGVQRFEAMENLNQKLATA
eukprot:CAMPEP_0172652006 /NCGR_PEP_ID=MMETSP1068-20121228/243099_1 /TAXON_ID=35684 /ORGANISM="Pseudopedinella elastica, Strain CCMP716" /LENGTH=266 /DNA_ID=CAMNT_0013466411 /DNA_START=773 /DNA_END=1573 /DNA_ORIENTATION=-